MSAYFKFWAAKAIVEITISLAVIGVIVLGAAISVWLSD